MIIINYTMHYAEYANKYSRDGAIAYATLVTPLITNIDDKAIFLDNPSITIQFNTHAGISTRETNEKFRYLLPPSMSVAFIDSPKYTSIIAVLYGSQKYMS